MGHESRTMAVVPSWIEAHCIVPDGFRAGQPFRLYDYQLRYFANLYLVRGDALWTPDAPILAPAFVYRRGLLVGPQKVGKNPMIATGVCVEGVGPALFAGWAGRDEGYVCRDWGCRCGWEYPYDPGEPMGMPWPTALIQITAFSQDSTENTYDALRPMIDLGPLHDLIPKTGELFIRLPNGGRIDTVTSSAQSRLGQRITHAPQDEVGIWTPRSGMTKVADTQYRNLAGTGGRASLTSNAWDPAQQSVGQVQFESKSKDIYRQFVEPPKNLSYANKRERHKIHKIVYPADTLRENGGHVDLEGIEAEAADLLARDEPQAMRFFGNILVRGSGKAFDVEEWRKRAVKVRFMVPDGTLITLGFDGSRLWDATSLIGTVVATGYQWPLGIWQRPRDVDRWEVPVDRVDATVADAFERFEVWRMYADPPFWESQIATWAGLYGKDRVVEWYTARVKAMGYALRTFAGAIGRSELTHCALADPLCELFTLHIGNAVRRITGYHDDAGDLWVVEKDAPGSSDKIDSVPAAALSWEARNDAITAGVLNVPIEVSAYETVRSIFA